MISYVELNKRIQKELDNKIQGIVLGSGEKVPEHFISGLKYAKGVLNTMIEYYTIFYDDIEVVSEYAYENTVKVLKNKLTESSEVSELLRSDRYGVNMALVIMKTHMEYLCYQNSFK